MCFLHFDNTFDTRARIIMEWVTRKIEILEYSARGLIFLYEWAMVGIRCDFVQLEEFEVIMGVHQSLNEMYFVFLQL